MATHDNAVKFVWTDEKIKRLKSLDASGASTAQIAQELGCPANSVKGKIWQLGLRGSGFEWTDEKIAEIIRLKKEGLSASEIAEKIGGTKGSVLGKLRRMGIYTPKELQSNSLKRSPKSQPRTLVLKGKAHLERKWSEMTENGFPHLDRPPVSLMDLKDDQCKWPVTHRPPHMFCGAPKFYFHPYCTCHQKMAWRRDV